MSTSLPDLAPDPVPDANDKAPSTAAGEHSPTALPAQDRTSTSAFRGKPPIAVIGGGFSGIIAALQLLRRLPADQPVLLVERSSDFANTGADDTHLLNVRATNMSALSDEPLHFQEWLTRHMGDADVDAGLSETEAGLFATHGLYGRYLRSLLDEALRQDAGQAQLSLLPGDVSDVVVTDQGGYNLICGDGRPLPVAGVVLAVGTLPPEEGDDPRLCRDAWGDKVRRPLESDRPVLIVGTGLTMVDLAIGLRRRGFAGGILALSRGGLLPSRHAAVRGAWPTPHFTMAEETSTVQLMTRLRDEAFAAMQDGVDWRAVIDSMRPVTASIWGRLPLAERRRFLRHARRIWDVHRHRTAPPHADLIEAMVEQGALRLIGGRILSMESGPELVKVRYAPKPDGRAGSAPLVEVEVQRVIMASGLDRISRTRDALMQRLLDRGLVRVDRQGLGIDVTDGLNVVRGDHTVAERIWALGPIVRGVFWECVAVPDIRVQAAHVAVSVVARLREDAPRRRFIV